MPRKTTAPAAARVDADATGVINPYALAELIAGRTIDWHEVADPRPVLADILATPYEELFDPAYESPLYLGLRLKGDRLERVRPAVLDVTPLEHASDDERFSFQDVRALRRIGDLAGFLTVSDVADIEIDRASYTESGILRVELAPLGESRLERLAHVFTPAIVQAVVHVDVHIDDRFAFEPPVSYWGDDGSFFHEAAEFFDPVQGAVANCYLIAAMSAVAWAQPYRIRHLTRATGTGQNQFVNQVRFFDVNSHATSDIEVTEAIPLRFSNGKPMYARSSETGETWPAIIEKAYAKWESGHTGDTPSIPSTEYGSPSRACTELTGLNRWSVATKDHSAHSLWTMVRQHSLSHRTFDPVVASTYASGGASPDKVVYSDANLVAGHAYTVLGWDYRNGTEYIILRNPWGSTEATLGSLAGSVSFYDISWWRTVNLAAADGVFGLEMSVFKSYFSHLGGAS